MSVRPPFAFFKRGAARRGAARRGAVRRGAARCGAVRRGAARCGAVRRGAARCGAVMLSRHEISKLNVVNASVMFAVRLMLSSAISALFLSYYRLPTRPEWRERDPRVSLGRFGLGTESAVRSEVDFGLLF
jgi:hypothetical protein